MSSATFGTANEDNAHLSKSESKTVQRRSLALLRSLIRPVRRRFWLTLAAVVLSQAARVAGPALIAFGIDRALPALSAGDNLPLMLTGAAYLAAAVATAGLTAVYVTSTAKLSQAMLLDLRVRVFRHTQRLSLEFHEKYTSGRIIARQTSDLEALRELLDSGVSSLASGMLFMVFTAATIVALDWRSGLLVLVAGVPMYFLARWYQKHSQIAFRESRVVSARLIVHFVETMTGIRAVKTFRKERENSARYTELSEDYRKVTVRSINLNGIFQPGLVLIGNVCVAVVLLFGGFRVLSGELAVGVLLALILSTKRFFQPVDQMAMFYNSFQSAQAALEKVSGLLEEVPTVRPPKNPVPLHDAKGSIDFTGVEFRYGDGPVIIPAMDLHIPAGQTVALVGQTGAGKSTLAKLIARFYDVSSGSLTLDGVDLRQLTTADLRRNVVMVTQEAFLFSGSVADNIALGRPEASRAGDRGRGPGRGRPRVHRGPPGRLRHRRQQARRPRLGRAAPADQLRPGVPGPPGRADPRRGHVLAGHPVRTARAKRARTAPAGHRQRRRPDGAHHRAPALHGGDRGPGPGGPRRPGGGGRHPRGADRRRRALRPAARGLEGLAGLIRRLYRCRAGRFHIRGSNRILL